MDKKKKSLYKKVDEWIQKKSKPKKGCSCCEKC